MNKRFMRAAASAVLSAALLWGLLPLTALAAEETGSGQGGLPYSLEEGATVEVGTSEEFEQFVDYVNGGGRTEGVTWTLTADIDTGGIAPAGTEDFPFAGTLDGGGYTVHTAFGQGGGYLGVIGYMDGGTVKNLHLGRLSFLPTQDSAGGIVGHAVNSRIESCSSVAIISVSGSAKRFGGIVGYAEDCVIENCTNSGAIFGSRLIGGIVGQAAGGTRIAGCSNSASIYAYGAPQAGGIAGDGERVTLESCTNTGGIMGRRQTGGIAGTLSESEVQECKNFAAISSGDRTGGVVGYAVDSSLERCFNTGAVSGGDGAGGVAGLMEGMAQLTRCSNTAPVDGGDGVGGVLGTGESADCVLSYVYNLGDVAAEGAAGGLKGLGEKGTISYSYNAADITGDTAQPLGGAVTYTKCYYEEGREPEAFSYENEECATLSRETLQSGDAIFGDAPNAYWDYQFKTYPWLAETESSNPSEDDHNIQVPPFIVYKGRPVSLGAAGPEAKEDIQYQFPESTLFAFGFERQDGGVWRETDTDDGAMAPGGAPAFAGKYRVTFSFSNVYASSVSMEFEIQQYELQSSDFSAEEVEGAPALQGVPKAVSPAAGSFLRKGDYEVSYDDVPTAAGKTTRMTIAGKNNCTGTLEFDIQVALGTAGAFAPAASGVYTVGAPGEKLQLEGDPTVYEGGVPAYLDAGKSYQLREAT